MTDAVLTPAAGAARRARKRNPQDMSPGAALARLLILFLIAGFVLIPLLATTFGGLKTLGELLTNPFGLTNEWIWQDYIDVLSQARVWQMLGNSLFIAIATVVMTLAVAAPAAFAFAHLKFIGCGADSGPLLEKAGVAADADDGLIRLGNPASAAAFVKACRKLRIWEREPAVKLPLAAE